MTKADISVGNRGRKQLVLWLKKPGADRRQFVSFLVDEVSGYTPEQVLVLVEWRLAAVRAEAA